MAKEKQDISETKDLARADRLAKKTEKLGKDITESELEEILSKYGTFEDSEIEKELLDKTLTTKKGYKIKVSEIYDGDFEGVDRTAIKIKVNTGDDGIVVLPISDKADCTIDWSDGEVESYPLASTELAQNEENSVKIASIEKSVKIAKGLSLGIEHVYTEKNVEKTVVINGEVSSIDSNHGGTTRGKIIEIEQWGETGLQEVYLGYCQNLRKIASPSRRSFENVTSFYCTFEECASLTQIPANLFANCQNVTSFNDTFSECTSLTGAPIELWTRGGNSEENSYQGIPDGAGCYYNCTGLDGYESIPSYWKQEPPTPI